MEARWLIETKFAPTARVRHQIERERILDRLVSEENRLVVVQAAAGFGKSTLLGQWARRLAAARYGTAWLNLDEDDRATDQFVAYLVEALRRCLVEKSGDDGTFPNTAGMPPKSALAAAIHELTRRQRPVALVLDDYHRAESDAVDAIMRGFLDRAAPSMRIAVASRSLPRLGLARLKAENRAAVVLDRDLRFTEDETSLFFAAEMGKLDRSEWTRFSARAEGWPVALQFARMWLREGGSLTTLSAASEATDLGSYLSEQIFAALRRDQQAFLLHTSPLETVSEAVAEAVGAEQAAQLMKDFARSALPVVILSPEPLRFRYHHLFQDFLVSRARAAGIDVADIHRKAARWFASSGDLAAAVRHALAGDDAVTAAAVVENAGGWRLVYRGQGHLGAILRSVHAALPGNGKTPPRLLLGAEVVAAKSGDLAAASALNERISSSDLDHADLADEIRVIDALIKLYLDQPLPEADLAHLMKVVGRMDADDPMTLALATNLAAFFALQSGHFARAKRLGERAIRHFRSADALFGEIHLYAHIGQADLSLGNLSAAAAAYRTMRDLCRRWLGQDSDLEAIAAVLEAEERYLADDRQAAHQLIEPALGRIEGADGWFDIFAAGYLTAVGLELHEHGPAAAFAVIERGHRTAARRGMERLAILLKQESIRVATIAGDIDRALAECEAAGLDLSVSGALHPDAAVSSLRGDGPALIAARLLIKLNRLDVAYGCLRDAAGSSKSATPITRRITEHVLRAALEDQRGKSHRAQSTLAVATGLAGREPYLRTILDEGEELRSLVARTSRDDAVDPLVRARLQRLAHPNVGAQPGPNCRGEDYGLSRRERQILNLLAEGLSNKEIARRIDRDPNTVKYHLKSLFAKLAVERRGRAVVRARDIGLIG